MVSVPLSAEASSAIVEVASISFVDVVLDTVKLPVVAVKLTLPLSVSMPATPLTVPTLNPSASTKLIFPVDVSIARVVTLVVVSENVTEPPAVMERLVSTMPPAVAVTLDPETRFNVATPVPELAPGVTSLAMVMAPADELPIVNSFAVTACSSVLLRL